MFNALALSDTDEYAPRAWVGCLGCYNEGRLIGAWLDLDGLEDSDTLEDICTRPDHEELWVMDHENLGTLDEMSPEEAAARGRALERVFNAATDAGVPVPVALEYYANYYGDDSDPDDWSLIGDDVMCTVASSEGDYVSEYIENLTGLPQLPYWLHIDYAGSFQDLTYDSFVTEYEGELYIFDQ